MRSGYTGHVTSSEWRWVITMSSALVLLAFIPFLWVVLSSPPQQQLQFMGALHDYQNAASDLSKIVQGEQGMWLTTTLHTPEPHTGSLMDFVYVLLGWIAQITSLETIIVFHVARVGAALFMYMAVYYLAAVIWMRIRTRRIFFILAVTGSGFGWLIAPLNQYVRYPDISANVMFPFHATLVNVHFPLTIGAISILTSGFIWVLRPGNRENPSVTNSGLIIFMLGLLITLIYPQALVPLVIAFVGLLLMRALRGRGISTRELRWILWFLVPALPLLAYYVIVFVYNPLIADIWVQKNIASPPDLLALVIGLGLPLLIAVPGLWRAVRYFEPDGNQFMLVWLVVMLLLMYLSPIVQMNFAIGLMIPLAFFGARAIEDHWFKLIARPWRYRILFAIFPLMVVSHLYVLLTPVMQLDSGRLYEVSGVLLQRDYAFAFQGLERIADTDDVVLAAPAVGTWLPAWSGLRVVYGSASETLDAGEKRQAINEWYQLEDPEACERLLNGFYSREGSYRVRFIFYGPLERNIGDTVCLDEMLPVFQFGDVTIYRNPIANRVPE